MAGITFLTLVAVCLVSETLTAPQNFREAKMPAPCEGKNFCHQKNKDYPQELINKMLDDLDYKIEEAAFDNEIKYRVGSGDLDDDCDREFLFAPIYEIIDNNDLVRYVIQSGDNYKQLIKTETCVNPGKISTSKFFGKEQLKELNLSCFEKRIEYRFQVLALDGNSLESVPVKGGLPVCCSCHVSNA